MGKSGESLPTLSSESSDSYTTPPVTVPPNTKNPYIMREDNPSGTVFIAVGAIVGAIILLFILYHLVKSFTASRMAKRSLAGDKALFEKYQSNNNTAYGGLGHQSPSLNLNSEYHLSVAKLPLLSHHRSRSVLNGFNTGSMSQVGDTSTIYASETGATSKQDLTKMFVSPTAEIMTHKKTKSGLGPQLFGGSSSNLSHPTPATNRHSQLIPSLYINNDINNSDYSITSHYTGNPSKNQNANQAGTPPGATRNMGRRAIPSMYLEDLIDKEQ